MGQKQILNQFCTGSDLIHKPEVTEVTGSYGRASSGRSSPNPELNEVYLKYTWVIFEIRWRHIYDVIMT